jgi:diadenosine tetraphosphatase ApaH/serine/threonine PP2A family protein phosphatase
VRLLLLSDIHANLEALEACLDAAPEYDGAANLGDVVGYGASPNQAIDMVRAMDPIQVRGNHDRCCSGLDDLSTFNPIAALAATWTRSQLSDKNLDWLRALPSGPLRDPEWEGVQFVHGSPLDEDAYVTSEYSATPALEAAPFPITFFGHSHVQCAFARRANSVEVQPFDPMPSASRLHVLRLQFDPKLKYMINPGSVGQPRDRDRRAAFAIYNDTEREILFYRVPYDIKRAQARILEAGLPQMLAFRLEEGR